jgi:CRISPR system Cascade subunit CasE
VSLYLSRLTLRRDASLAALGPLLARGDHGPQAGIAHRLVWTAFADHADRRRDFLWREDQARRRWFVLSERPPTDVHSFFEVETKSFEPFLAEGNRLAFALRANAVVTRKADKGKPKRIDVVMDRLHAIPKGERALHRDRLAADVGRDWLATQGSKAGFRLADLRDASYRTSAIPRRQGKPIELGILDLEGTLTIEDPEPFLTALATGFGKAKSFGCGLMLIRRAR